MPEKSDYRLLDRPEILRVLFYPRPDYALTMNNRYTASLMVPVAPDVAIQIQAHIYSPAAPTILFFHGNGEIASDYQEIAPFFTGRGLNLMVADYRGYGNSSGLPSVSAMMADALEIYDYVRKWLLENSFTGRLLVMGRSLGSASALEIAARHGAEIDGLIIESGFAYLGPLLRLLGVEMELLNLTEEQGFNNIAKIREFTGPTLIIHAQYDQIISFREGEALYAACPAKNKRLLRISGANHNNIFIAGMTEYMAAIVKLAATGRDSRTGDGA
ncbi:MAG TPA: alpha/beta hydrolase [Syntrophales bacterium]|jgi:hypothetical protein|nr:alpha/beta hydrolase [Syntrophales bacterium]HOU76627.1 alpha/beta hydrolase [Syntrophales bacterium]HQG33290.1 alpha/beta hydrolase [Syntrophales bacterium]HQI35066.1 alpha/beta hydrolase [Syntrophales bacterium]